MCGIAGIIYRDGSIATNYSDTLQKMLLSIAHRGPDGEGVFFENNISLGHRRLAILDLSESGHQPMCYKDFVIVYNGEIFNYIELQDILKKKGHRFTTRTDTEVILHAYEEWGEECLERFNGMWAFVLYDRSQQKLFCSRDRYGIKPFYYYTDSTRIFIASEIKSIITAGVNATADYDVLITYLVTGFINYSESTFFNKIHQLLPGYKLVIDLKSNKFHTYQYYNLANATNNNVSVSDYAKNLKNSVRLHLRSDVPVGTCLSGGLDSSVVAALSSSILQEVDPQKKFCAITAISELKSNDESAYARIVSEHCGLDWHTVRPSYSDFKEHIYDCLMIQEEPVGGPSIFMQYWVMRAAKEVGLKVMLDGQGGDETMLGYERYYPSYFVSMLRRFNYLTIFREYYQATKHSKLTFITLTMYVFYFLSSHIRIYMLHKRAPFIRHKQINSIRSLIKEQSKIYFNIKKLQVSEICKYQMPKLLTYEDKNSMAHSIEARVPFVEINCIETAISMMPEMKIKNGFLKYPLRILGESILPKSIAWRTSKIGFEAPAKLWLDQHDAIMQSAVDKSVLLNEICTKIPRLCNVNLDMRWRLYNIAVWESQYSISHK